MFRRSAGMVTLVERIERYRIRAAKCRGKANMAAWAETKEQFEDMARQWDELADRLEEPWGIGRRN